ncbi:hypothetical protein WJX75_004168 [Coccomyxa subellipsoidea]|uniref:Uncharacterized protein n=1 Tax=Coccomyxa subellipsoidea TaxID=248742 RepID=A0ABR2YCZ3_9CHLO
MVDLSPVSDSMNSGQEDVHQDLGESSSDDSDLDLLLPAKVPASSKAQQRPKGPPEAVSYEALQAAGFDGGPSLLDASQEISRARKQQKEEERVAAEEAAKKQAEEYAADEAARQQRKKVKHQSPADSLQQKERIMTQAEARGAALRAQATAQLESKYDFGQALDVSTYSGAAKKEADRKQAKESAQTKRRHNDA